MVLPVVVVAQEEVPEVVPTVVRNGMEKSITLPVAVAVVAAVEPDMLPRESVPAVQLVAVAEAVAQELLIIRRITIMTVR